MTAQRKRRGRKPATILRRLDMTLRNARTYLVDLDMRGECAVRLIEARALVAELRAALKGAKT